MNKSAIKNFAIWARNKFIADITYKAGLLGISEKEIKEPLPQSTKDVQFFDIGTKEPYSISGVEIKQREALAEKIRVKSLELRSESLGSRYKSLDSELSTLNTALTNLSTLTTAFQAVVEEVAYTWFNRLIAVRFMEVNEYIPSRVRVISSESAGKDEPDLVTNPFDTDLEFTPYEKDRIMQLKQENQLDELFRLLFIKQCNALNAILPNLFEKTSDYTELLLNVAFTDKDGVVYHLVHDIPEADFKIRTDADEEAIKCGELTEEEAPSGQVEIIGWLYQYYNTEPKDETFALLKKNVKITKERIPAATQLFTPDWIVRYMVENSLGRIFIEMSLKGLELSEQERIAKEKSIAEKMGWKYYLPEAEQEPEVRAELNSQLLIQYNDFHIEDLKVIDPCMGSGHILVYAFDVLMQIYKSSGYSQRDAAKRIIENNIFGLDIDNRAYQLACFALMMKARQYNRRILNGETKPHVYAIQESNGINRNQLQYFGAGMDEMQHNVALLQVQGLLDTFIDAKEYGSILNVDSYDWELLRQFIDKLDLTGQLSFDAVGVENTQAQLRLLVEISFLLARKYDVVVTNPPYMGSSGMSNRLSDYVKTNFQNGKNDLFACFIEKSIEMLKCNGMTGLMTSYTWMFLTAYSTLRENLIDNVALYSLIQPEYHAFFQEAFVPICTFILRNSKLDYFGRYIRLEDFTGADQQSVRALEAINNNDCGYLYTINQIEFKKIPNCPIAYWLNTRTIDLFESQKALSEYADLRQGLITGDNDRFLRFWYECDKTKITISKESPSKWYFYHKGGEFRKWYGNIYLVVNWENDGYEISNFKDANGKLRSRPQNVKYYQREGFTWTALTVADFNVRYMPSGAIFDAKGSSGFCSNRENLLYFIAMCNAKPCMKFLSILSPTMDYNAGAVSKVPAIVDSTYTPQIIGITEKCIQSVKQNWDLFEISWDFKTHPLIVFRHNEEANPDNLLFADDLYHGAKIVEFGKNEVPIRLAYEAWERFNDYQFDTLKANEEELNRIFIDIYGLQDELTPEVEDKDVTVRKADLGRDIRSFISYAVGCMFGRYSLDKKGLVFAGGDFEDCYRKYKGQAALDKKQNPIHGGYAGMSLAHYRYADIKVDSEWKKVTYEPDVDNILPVTDEEYFEDDIVGLFVAFVKKVYGVKTLEENLDFIAKALGNKGDTPREIIRNYFLKDFFKDHCKIYPKRPIYWLFDSGKANGFKALIYMHRYDENTIGNLRIDYLHKMQRVYEREIVRMQETIDNSTNAREVAAAEKRKDKLTKQLKETKEYDEKVAHLALARIAIDLDDGVKVNYEKVQTGSDGKKLEVLAKI